MKSVTGELSNLNAAYKKSSLSQKSSKSMMVSEIINSYL
jgi:hypothetical protein